MNCRKIQEYDVKSVGPCLDSTNSKVSFCRWGWRETAEKLVFDQMTEGRRTPSDAETFTMKSRFLPFRRMKLVLFSASRINLLWIR